MIKLKFVEDHFVLLCYKHYLATLHGPTPLLTCAAAAAYCEFIFPPCKPCKMSFEGEILHTKNTESGTNMHKHTLHVPSRLLYLLS